MEAVPRGWKPKPSPKAQRATIRTVPTSRVRLRHQVAEPRTTTLISHPRNSADVPLDRHFPDGRGPSPSVGSGTTLGALKAKFPPSERGRARPDARHGGPARLQVLSRLTAAPRGRTPGAARPPAALRGTLRASAWGWVRRPQPRDAIEEAAEQLARHRHLRHLENRVVAVADDLRPDLHHLLPQAG